MGATIVEGNQKSLNNMVDQGMFDINEALNKMLNDLGEYGFDGEVELNLSVRIRNKTFGGLDAEVGRSTKMRFKR